MTTRAFGMDPESLQDRIRRVTAEPIEIADYDPRWPAAFEREKEHLLDCLPRTIVRRIEHFGSTAVPGLAAKPIIDMLVEVTDLVQVQKQVVPVLETQGYDYFWRPTFGDDGEPFYAWFIKRDPGTGRRTHHIHMVEASAEFTEHWERLLFRDYLIAHPGIAREYEHLKRDVASRLSYDRVAYTQAKGDFIRRITDAAKHGV